MKLDLQAIREQFPALARQWNGNSVIYLDGPAGSQVPRRVADAVSHTLLHCNANEGGLFETSLQTGEMVAQTMAAADALVGAPEPGCVAFGANMTTLTFAFSRALAATWRPGDEIIVSDLDHDANVTPWVLAARDAGVTVHAIPVTGPECTLDLERYGHLLSERTRLVAVGLASNLSGTINPVAAMSAMAHEVGAEVFVDAVHFAPHGRMDVVALGCDYLVCSAYKFFGPHVGLLWGRRERLAALPAYKVRPASDSVPFRWMTGTPNMEGLAGTLEAIRYLASLSSQEGTLTERLVDSFERIRTHEMALSRALLQGICDLPNVTVWGLTDLDACEARVPTVSFTHSKVSNLAIAQTLAEHGISVWHGNHYALRVSEVLGLEPGGTLRVGCLHYNTLDEIERLMTCLGAIG